MSRFEQELGFFKALALASPWSVSRADTEINQYPLPSFTEAYHIVRNHLEAFYEQPRWEVYDVSPTWGDMSVAEHSVIRQITITAQALSYDAEHFDLKDREIDLVLSATLLHDLGEAIVGDVTLRH